MNELFSGGSDHWFWLVLAVILGILEVVTTTTLILWMAIAAVLVGLLLLVIPDLQWEIQFLAFAGLSVLAITVWRSYLIKRPIATDEPRLNRRGEQYIGRTFTLASDIVNGVGMLKVGDTLWRVEGPDLAQGTQVVVNGVEGASLKVEPKSD